MYFKEKIRFQSEKDTKYNVVRIICYLLCKKAREIKQIYTMGTLLHQETQEGKADTDETGYLHCTGGKRLWKEVTFLHTGGEARIYAQLTHKNVLTIYGT